MKKLILIAALIGLAGSVMAETVNIAREVQGSGVPGLTGTESATLLDNSVFHAPQYMPGYPTAATLYPRIIDVSCVQTGDTLNCNGYNWMPQLGRGEYLMIRPVITVAPKQAVITKTEVKEVIRNVYVEVPAKAKKE